ncbi:hypothetical protein W97_02665 [Coniosporium apollinis CBS 100218]|uniref:MARVEL domain-containing protein n=1 Tax=Coniosporium apollinis (strain CBS 100218) TaxID=1168221 RepID=R7YNJ6_CONA1|nr:uncharacterized protein W97_02665 [Coniosporium apollinis CBS 100218]EON63438.1 hypothetical protein W97_02665 [Coniosporium apollinis CBS 100218]
MAVIWGLDLHEIRWSKFANSNMWSRRYHLRRTKFIVYQLAMILCVVSESLGTAALSDYVSQQRFIERHDGRAAVHNDDFVGAASYNIFVGIYVATIFGAGFFFDLIWPERRESRAVRWAWRVCSVLACLFALSSAIAVTVITASSRARITGVDAATARADLKASGDYPLEYSSNAHAIASVVFEWAGLLATIAATIVLWMSYRHNERFGPLSAHVRAEEGVKEKNPGVEENANAFDAAPVTGGTSQTEPPRHEAV